MVASGFRDFRGQGEDRRHLAGGDARLPDIVFRAWPGSIEVRGENAAMRSYTEEIFLRDGALHRTLDI
jgi:hypothetical protein